MSARRLDVLLVDDDVAVLRATAALLAHAHEVRGVAGCREAIEAMLARVPDAIVCDLELPPYSGAALLSMVADEYPHVRRVLYTGTAAPALADGVAHRVLSKPASLQELLHAIAGDDS